VDYAIYMIDVDSIVRSWNAGAERLKGYSADEIIGKPFSSFYSPEDRAKGLPQTALNCSRNWPLQFRGLARPQRREPVLGARRG
jgi:PAS domain S-box-containing protein